MMRCLLSVCTRETASTQCINGESGLQQAARRCTLGVALRDLVFALSLPEWASMCLYGAYAACIMAAPEAAYIVL